MMLYEEGAFELKDPVARFLPDVRRQSRVPQRQRLQAGHRSAHRADPDLAPAHAHRRPDVRVPPPARHRRDLPVARLRVGCADGHRPRGGVRSLGRAAARAPAGSRVELRRRHRRARAECRGGVGDERSTSSSASGSSARSACATPPSTCPRARWRARPACTARSPGTGRAVPSLDGSGAHLGPPVPVRWRWAVGHRRRLPPLLPTSCSGAASSTASRLLGTRTVDYMTRNHLPGGADLERFGRPLFSETTYDGVGFGLGFSVIDRSGAQQGARLAGRVRVGRRGEHGVLVRSARADRRGVR